MKKILSVVLVVLMAALMMAPAFAEGGNTVTFVGPSDSLANYGRTDAPYCFVVSKDGRMEFVEDPNGKYYLANDGYYYTADRIMFDPNDTSPRKTYSPKTYSGTIDAEANSVVSFKVLTNEVYNAATAAVYVNGELMTPDSFSEYKLYVDRNLTVTVKESALLRSHFSVKMTSGEGYSVKTLQGQSAHFALYGDDFKFRVKIGSGYSDANLSVKVLRGGSGLDEFLGDDGDLDGLMALVGYNTETLVSDGVDSEGARTYTIKNVTSNCKVVVSGVRTKQKADIFTYLKRFLKMILDALHIDSSFLGLTELVAYYDVLFDDSAMADAPEGTDYSLLSGIFDEFKPVNMTREENGKTYGYFTVMNGESVTVRLTTRNKELRSSLGVKWKIGDRDEVTTYGNTWTASFDTATGYVYYTTTIQVDNITGKTYITLVK